MTADIKKPGHCTLCDEPVFDIPAVISGEDHPYHGHPVRCDAPHEGARRVTYRCKNGSLMSLTFGTCDNCTKRKLSTKKIMKELWAKVVRSARYEVENLVAIKGPRFAVQIEKQRKANEARLAEMEKGGFEKLLDDEKWTKVEAREGRVG